MTNFKELATVVAKNTSNFFNKPISVDEIFNPRTRYRENVVARTIFTQLLRERGMTYMDIKKVTGEDHSTLVHRVKKYESSVHSEKMMYDHIMSEIPKSLSGTITYSNYKKSVKKLSEELMDLIEKEDLSQKWVSTKCKYLTKKLNKL